MRKPGQTNQGHDDPDLISRPSKAPAGAAGRNPPSIGTIPSTGSSTGKVPNDTFKMKTGPQHVSCNPPPKDRHCSDGRMLPPSDGAWFSDPEAGSDSMGSKSVSDWGNDADMTSVATKAPAGRAQQQEESSWIPQREATAHGTCGRTKSHPSTRDTSLNRTGYNSLKVAVAHLKEAQRASLKNPYQRSPYAPAPHKPSRGAFDDPDIIFRPHSGSMGSLGTRPRT
jgi:hypothetical protein